MTYIGDIATFQRGDAITVGQISTGPYPVIAGGITPKAYSDSYNRDAECITISSSGTAGYVSFWQTPILLTDAFSVDVNTEKADKRYVYYLLKAIQSMIMAKAKGSIIPHVYPRDIASIELPISDKTIQSQQSAILHTIDSVIANCSKNSKELTNLTSLIYDYWFVQFDFPDENGRPYKSSGGKMVCNDELGRKIPAGWSVAPLTSTRLCSLIKPGISKFNGTKRYLPTACINNTTIDFSKANTIHYNTRESRANMQPAPNSIWFAKMKDSVKHIYLTESSIDIQNNCIFSTGLVGLQADRTSSPYISSFINNDHFEEQKDYLSHGATQKAVNNNDLSCINVIEPSTSILSSFAKITYPMFDLLDATRQISNDLASLRDWLLPMLMNGQVTIKDAD